MVLATGEPAVAPLPAATHPRPPRLAPLLAVRRRTLPVERRLAAVLGGADRWLEAQPQLALVVAAAAVAVLLFR